ncbi:hypothetical protein BASA81_003292 [Batrachochytrium salamandrivorans]|nr:hypothetical protein BASA81_003292 [Batrachochytrium salamandrivorans]
MARSSSIPSEGGNVGVYRVIFIFALCIWIFLQTQERYVSFVTKARAQNWATPEGIAFIRNSILSSAAVASGAEGEEGEEPAPSAAEEEDGEKTDGAEVDGAEPAAEGEEEGEDSVASGQDGQGGAEEHAKIELTILERAVASRLEEERLYQELIKSKHGIVLEITIPQQKINAEELLQENVQRELESMMEAWKGDFNRIRATPQTAEEIKLQEWEDLWEKRELDRMLEEAKKTNGHMTITGRRAPAASLAANEASLNSNTKIARPHRHAHKSTDPNSPSASSITAAGKKATQPAAVVEEMVEDFGVDAAVPLRISTPPSLYKHKLNQDPDAVEELLQVLRSLESNMMQWTESSKKNVIVLGEKVYIGRDFKVYKWAFSQTGFNIKFGSSASGKMSTKHVVGGDWSVLLCLALNTEHCFTSSNLGQTKRYQKINRVQGLRKVLWSKDSFCETVSNSARGLPVFTRYIFDCWIFPREYPQALAYAQKNPGLQYIVKPLSMGGGMGISVVDGEKGLHKERRRTHIVQSYLKNPMLINQKKWDLRTYVLVTSVVPLRAYVYSRGLVRFASSVYDPTAKGGGKKTQFLTNTSINKHYVRKGNVTDITWDFERLKQHLDSLAPGTHAKLLGRMQAAISVVLLSAERSWRKYFDSLGGEMCGNCYQLMGVDLIVDDELKPRVIEVNGQPSMQLTKSEDDHYTTTKRNMIRDMVGMVYNEDRVAHELAEDLSAFDRDVVTQLTTRDHEYLLEYAREKLSLGGWLPVYPSHRNHRLHDEFFRFQKSPPTEDARWALHHILGALEQRLFDNGGPKARSKNPVEVGDEGLELDDGEVVVGAEEDFGNDS